MTVSRLALLALVGLGISLTPRTEARVKAEKPDAPKADLFVSLDGRDQWSGHLPAPNPDQTDGPFQTLERARQEVLQIRKNEPNRDRPITILVRGGTYRLDKALIFSPEDSGSVKSPVIYAAYPGESPVISGARRVDQWKQTGQGRWVATLPEVKEGSWRFSQLFVDGQRRYRPRWPGNSYSFINGNVEPTEKSRGRGFDRFRFSSNDLSSNWHDLNAVEVLVFHTWTMSRLRVESINEADHVVTFTGPTRGTASWSSLSKGQRFLAENVLEALDEPGEWYLDRESGTLTYLPKPGEQPASTVVEAPRLETLVRLSGDVKNRRWVEHLEFRGLTFSGSNWYSPPQGNSFPQAEAMMSATIEAEGARGCSWSGCSVKHVGGYAVELGPGCRENLIDNCDLTDLGAGGIKIGETVYRGDDEAVASDNTVRQTLIAHGGRMHPAAVGVWIGHSPRNTIAHNEITDFYYSGISVGWSWGYGKSHAHHNRFEANHIHNLGQGVLSDMGGIYSLGVSPGTEMTLNRIHDVQSFDYGGWGIYFDEGSTDVLARDNLVYRTKTGGFHQHYGRDNRVLNNIFAFSQEGQIIRTRPEDHRSFTFERNIVYWSQGTLLGSNWSGDGFLLDHNLYWNTTGEPIQFAGQTLDEWRKRGQDVHSRIANPRFADPEHGDFHLPPDSPAFEVGFKPFDLSTAGRSNQKPVSPLPRAFPPPPGPQPLNDGFEHTSVGAKADGPTTSEEPKAGTVRVTDNLAASGRHSLLFSDAPGLQYRFNPHIHYGTRYTDGVLGEHFSLLWKPGAVFYHEWRDAAHPYHVGPSLRVEADGTLSASGRNLGRIPSETWVRIDLTCALGKKANGRYDLSVQLPEGSKSIREQGLPCDPQFRTLRWLGFVADADRQATFAIDDLDLRPRPEETEAP